jgi:hypothetical protein
VVLNGASIKPARHAKEHSFIVRKNLHKKAFERPHHGRRMNVAASVIPLTHLVPGSNRRLDRTDEFAILGQGQATVRPTREPPAPRPSIRSPAAYGFRDRLGALRISLLKRIDPPQCILH